MTGLAHSENAGFPDIFAWLEGPFVSPRPVAAQAMRMEEHVAGGRYVVQAELPGVDPAKDMEVSVSKGILTVRAKRHEDMQGQHRSEFRYGPFTRHIALPVTADANDIKATYHWGTLEVSIGLHDADEDKAGRHPSPDHRLLTTSRAGHSLAGGPPLSEHQSGPVIWTGRRSEPVHRTSERYGQDRTRSNVSPAEPPCTVGSVSEPTNPSNSMTEPGQPCVMISGNAFPCCGLTWMKWMPTPSMQA